MIRAILAQSSGATESAAGTLNSVLTVLFCERARCAVEGELSGPDAISVAPDDCAKIALIIYVAVERIVAEDHIGELAVAVRHFQRHHGSAIVGNGGLHAVLVRKHVEINRLAVGSFPERPLFRGTGFWCRTKRRQCGHEHGSRERTQHYQPFHSNLPPANLTCCNTRRPQKVYLLIRSLARGIITTRTSRCFSKVSSTTVIAGICSLPSASEFELKRPKPNSCTPVLPRPGARAEFKLLRY